RCWGRVLDRLRERQAHGEGRTLAHPRTLPCDRSTLHFDQLPAHRQPDAEATLRTVEGPLALRKQLEHVGQKLGADPLPVIRDLNDCEITISVRADANLSARF